MRASAADWACRRVQYSAAPCRLRAKIVGRNPGGRSQGWAIFITAGKPKASPAAAKASTDRMTKDLGVATPAIAQSCGLWALEATVRGRSGLWRGRRK